MLLLITLVDLSLPVDPTDPTFNHFTQVVWKGTTQVGCAAALCDNIFASQFGPATYHVCVYNPVGNVVGEETCVIFQSHLFVCSHGVS